MDVRLAADRRRIAQLRGDESHRRGDVALRLGLRTSRPEFREYGRGTESSAPGAEVLRTERDAERLVEVRVHVARGEVSPTPLVLIAEEPRAGRAKMSRDE